MTKGRTPIADTPVVYSFASPREVGRRWTDVRAFWDPQAGDQLRCDILHRYNAVYLVVDKRKSPMRVSERYAFTSPLFENAHFAVYQVRR
jgi:hypothetical protein